MSISVSSAAVDQARRLRAAEGHPDDWGIRVAITSGGCSGYKYDIGFCPPGGQEGDRPFEVDGITLYVEHKSYLFLIGTEMAWESTLMKTGFVFRNPNVTAACGCGESVTF
jgi:iron-sulfur cluster assembly protein